MTKPNHTILRRSVAFLTVWVLSVASVVADPVIDGILSPGDNYSHGFAVSADIERGPTIHDAELYLHKGSNGDMSVLLRFPRSLNDNSYGDNSIGWGKGVAPSGKNHNYKDLTGSDTTEFVVKLAAGAGGGGDGDGGDGSGSGSGSGGGNGGVGSVFGADGFHFVLDFIQDGNPLVHGLDGEGEVISGKASDLLAAETSFSRNYSIYGQSHPGFFSDNASSPAASNNYIVLNPTFSEWEFSIIYEFKIKGSSMGNWDPSDPSSVIAIGTSHHSPNKIAKNKVTNFRPGNPIDPPGGGGGGGGNVPDVLCAINTAEQCGEGDPYGMWLPNLHSGHSDATFEFTDGEFSGLSSGDARLTAVARIGNGNGFSVDVTFTGRQTVPPPGSPKGPINVNCYTPDTSDWFYYEAFTGTLTGLPGTDYEGAVITVTRREKPFQVGVGANRQTNDMGASGWFDWELQQQTSTGLALHSGANGDFNFELESCSPDLPTVSISDARELECEGPMKFEICLSQAVAEPVTVSYETRDGAAKNGEDFTGGSSTIVIPAGATCVFLSIPLIEDGNDEDEEDFEVALTSATGATIDDGTGKGRIEDCEPAVPDITINDVVVLECDGPAIFEICLSELSRTDVTVEYKTKDGSAKKNKDYEETKGTLTIKAGEICAWVEVPIINDRTTAGSGSGSGSGNEPEGDEDFKLELKNPTGANLADNKGEAIIKECEKNDIEITIKDAYVLECDGPIRFEVCLSENAPEEMTIEWRTIAGTASSGGGDYDGTSGRDLTFAEGEQCKFISITVNEDRENEGIETFEVSIQSVPNGYTVVDGRATGTIEDCDQPPTIADDLCVVDTGLNCGQGDDYSMWIPNLHDGHSDKTLEFTAGQFTGLQSGDARLVGIGTLGNGNGFLVDVTFTGRTVVPPAGSPKAQLDPDCYDLNTAGWFYYTGFTGTLTGLPGTDYEGAVLTVDRRGEAFQVGPGANRQTAALGASGWFDWEVTQQPSTGLSLHDDGIGDFNYELEECDPSLPSVSVSGVGVLECEGPAEFEICLSEISPVDVVIDYQTQDGTATAPADYTSTSGQLTIPAGSLCGTVQVAIVEDSVQESLESFSLVLTGASGATIGTGTGTAEIEDCEIELPEVSVLDAQGELECEGPAVFEICLEEITKTAIDVTYETRDVTAIAGQDYVAQTGTVTIAVGERCAEIRIDLLEDFDLERDETFELVITGAVGATIGDAVGTGTIKDCPPDPITIAITDTRAKECEGPMTFQVCLSRISDVDITVDFSTADGSAIAGQDYTAGTGTLTIPAGTLCVDLEIPTLEDNVTESPETFVVNLSNSSGPQIVDDQGTGTIFDCPPDLPTISINNVSVFECKGPAEFEVCLSEVSANDVTVTYVTVDGTAEAPGDYASGTGTLTIPAGTQCVTFTVGVVDDGADEGAETFLVNLSNPTNATIDDGQGVGTIHDCDPEPPTVSISSALVGECDGTGELEICLSEVSSEDVTVSYATVDGTAEAPGDYTPASGTITIPAGTKCVTISVTLIHDNIDELPETVLVNLSNPVNATIGDGQGVITIQDCEKPEISITGKVVSECADNVELQVCLSETSPFDVTFDFATSDGSATAGADYVTGTGTITIPAGQLCGTVTVDLLNENVAEPDETFLVTISNAQGATIVTDEATVTIEDCTVPPDEPTISILDPDLVRECEEDQVVFVVCLSEASDEVVTVQWTTQDGSATAGQDYVAGSGTLTFQPGNIKPDAPIVIALIDDDVDEAPEQFSVVLSNPTNAVIVDGTGVATIQDCGDDPTAVELIAFSVEQDGLGGVTVTWETASEFETAGFELHRASMANNEAFDLRKITPKMLVSRGSIGEGASYHHSDRPGFGRFVYQLEEVELDGHRERRGTVAIDVAPMIGDIEFSEEGVVLSFPTMADWNYTVEVCDSISGDGVWVPVSGAPHNTGRVVDADAKGRPGRFYRVTAEAK